MNDMERRKFEDSFQEAFKDAEVSPSDNVWTNIELDLERAEGGKMKRRLVFFKMLAAASITFAVLFAGIGYYVLNDRTHSSNLANEVPPAKESIEVIDNEQSAVDNIKNEKSQHEKLIPADSKPETTAPSLANQSGKSAARDKTNGALQEAHSTNSKNPNQNQSIAKRDLEFPIVEKTAETNNVDKNELSIDHKIVESNSESDNSIKTASKIGDGAIQNSITVSKIDQERIKLDNKIVVDNDRTPIAESFEKKSLTNTNNTASVGHLEEINPGAEPGRLQSFYQPKNPELQLPATNADPGVLLLAKLADEERAYTIEDKKKQKVKAEKLWTSVGFAAGGFNSPNPSVSPQAVNFLSTTSSNVATKQSKASGLAYSVGVSVGANLSDRWVLQGGVNYLTQSSDYTANNVIVPDNSQMGLQAESINAYNDPKLAGNSQSRVAQTFPYNVNNNVQFVSVPVQAGYLVVNKKFGVQMNAGISTDLFLQNTITPEGGGLTKTTQSRGDDSPYRSVNFSGLMGTELSYKLGYRYRLSLNPGLRYPLNSVYKSDTGVQATPLTFDVGLRFRYIFH